MERSRCKCGKQLIQAIGPVSSDFLLIGEFPGHHEIVQGIPFVGPTGDILRGELARAGLSYHDCRLTNLWQHAKDEKECDIALHLNVLAKEMLKRPYILLMGSDLTKLFFNTGVMELSGLEIKHDSFPKSRIFVSPNPAIVMHGPVGEFRLAIERFVEAAHG